MARVKRFEAGIVRDPITVTPDMPVRDVIGITHQYRISGLPVVRGREVVGIVTNRDLRFETRLDQPVSSIMTPRERLVTVREGASLHVDASAEFMGALKGVSDPEAKRKIIGREFVEVLQLSLIHI